MAVPKKKSTPQATRKKSTKQVMDVARPGKTKPSASARPVIVGHRPVVQDPMVNEGKSMPESDSEEHKITVKRTAPKVIAPLKSAEDLEAEAKAEASAAESAEPETPELPVPDQPAEEESAEVPEEAEPAESPDADVEPATPETDTPEGPAADAEEPALSTEEPTAEPEETPPETTADKDPKSNDKSSKDKGSSSSDKGSGNKKDDKKNAELERRLAEVEKLADEKKYFVHTSHTTKKQRKTGLIIAIVLLLAAVGAYLAIDAQLIKNDIKLPYEFFKEEQQPESTSANHLTTQDAQNQPEQAGEEEAKPTVSDASKDARRQADLKAAQGALESYYNEIGYYPSLDQINDTTFRASQPFLKNLDGMYDPDGSSKEQFIKAPAAKAYAYEAKPVGCDNQTTTFRCESYILTATLSNGQRYELDSANEPYSP